MSIDERNRRVYGRRDVAAHYAGERDLQPAERTIFGLLEGELERAVMLDIGVGGGRTTQHFAPRVKRYVAVDYSSVMLDAVRARFPGTPYQFLLADARALPFEDSSFDIVLFSHNGIDYVDHEDRLRVLAEVRRVLWPGGAFVFSTHNLDREDLDFAPRPGEGFFMRAARSMRRARLRAENPDFRANEERDHAIINDGAFAFRAATYHIRVGAQIAQLDAAGFERIRAFSGVTGAEIAANEWPRPDPWIYFLCRTS